MLTTGQYLMQLWRKLSGLLFIGQQSLCACEKLDAVMVWYVCILLLGLLHCAASLRHHDDETDSSASSLSSSSVSMPWNARRHRRAKDDGTCELEIHCGGKGDGQRTSTSGVVRLPIRGQRGPPATPEHHSIDHPPRFRYGTHRAPAGHQRPWSVNLDHQGRLERKATKVKAEQMDVQVCYFILITIIGS